MWITTQSIHNHNPWSESWILHFPQSKPLHNKFEWCCHSSNSTLGCCNCSISACFLHSAAWSLRGKNSHLTLLVLRQAFASHTGQVVIPLWIFWSGPVKYESHQTVTVNYAPGDFCHHCDFERWKPGRYESQRQWNFVSRKLGVATFYLCLSSTFLKLLFYGTGGLSISILFYNIIECIAFDPLLEKGLLSLGRQ